MLMCFQTSRLKHLVLARMDLQLEPLLNASLGLSIYLFIPLKVLLEAGFPPQTKSPLQQPPGAEQPWRSWGLAQHSLLDGLVSVTKPGPGFPREYEERQGGILAPSQWRAACGQQQSGRASPGHPSAVMGTGGEGRGTNFAFISVCLSICLSLCRSTREAEKTISSEIQRQNRD